jgi:hypothetical protein
MNEYYLPLIAGTSLILNAVLMLMYLKQSESHDKEIESCHSNYKEKIEYKFNEPTKLNYEFKPILIEPYYPKEGDKIKGLLLPHKKREIYGTVIRETRRGNFEVKTSNGDFKLICWVKDK